MTAPFKPSQVDLGIPPLVGIFGRAEIEHAISMVVHALAETDNTWRGISWSEIQAVLRADVEAKRDPFCHLLRNPFFKPDIHAAVTAGYATWEGEIGKGPVRLTASAVEALRPWVLT